MAKITYTNKVTLNEQPSVADINKVTDDDMNEIKNVVNTNDDNVGDLSNLKTTTKTSVVGAINEMVDGETYSTNETKTNKIWINGKPMYRKVFVGTSTGTVNISSLNMEEGFIDMAHSYIYWSRYTPVQLTTTSASNVGNYMAGAYINGTHTSLVLEAGSNIIVTKYIITLEYTKTTD